MPITNDSNHIFRPNVSIGSIVNKLSLSRRNVNLNPYLILGVLYLIKVNGKAIKYQGMCKKMIKAGIPLTNRRPIQALLFRPLSLPG